MVRTIQSTYCQLNAYRLTEALGKAKHGFSDAELSRFDNKGKLTSVARPKAPLVWEGQGNVADIMSPHSRNSCQALFYDGSVQDKPAYDDLMIPDKYYDIQLALKWCK